MSTRPPPPMYRHVKRKVVPVVQPRPVQTPVISTTPTFTITSSTPVGKVKPEVPKVASTKKKTPKKAKPTWTEDMTQKELYRIAKDAGLKVRTRDWKSEIIQELRKAKIA